MVGQALQVRRYLRDRPLPRYAYVPGEHPHPTRDPGGHSYRREPEPLATAFLWGVDLYNHGYLWEAHEAWEGLWRAARRDSAEAAFFKGLIQCAAACLKIRSAQARAARALGDRALGHLERAIAGQAETHGLELPSFTRRFATWIRAEPEQAETRPRIELESSTS